MKDPELLQTAIDFMIARFDTGEACIGAARTKTGQILTSVHTEARVDSAFLCAETGAICEAHKLNDPITASLCLIRAIDDGPMRILPACGICQERLAFWGMDVLIGVPLDEDGLSDWTLKPLKELRPHYWGDTL